MKGKWDDSSQTKNVMYQATTQTRVIASVHNANKQVASLVQDRERKRSRCHRADSEKCARKECATGFLQFVIP